MLYIYIYTMEYYSALERNEIGSFVEMWMDLESVIQSDVSQKEKHKYRILTHICGIQKNNTDEPNAGQEQRWRHRKQMCEHRKGNGGGTN